MFLKVSRCCAALLAAALFIPAPAGATSATGTVIGSVTCGPSEETPATHVMVDVEGTNLNVRTDGAGKFSLFSVPAGQSLIIDAALDGNGSVTSSRYNVLVHPGETLDVGNLDLAACPQPAAPPADDSSPMWDGGAE